MIRHFDDTYKKAGEAGGRDSEESTEVNDEADEVESDVSKGIGHSRVGIEILQRCHGCK